jgi:hypothetical protein
MWPETNCYIDLWIEVLSTLGLAPEAMLGFTLGQDFEGDQFTFFKVPLEDLEALYGIRVTELAIFDKVERHIETQISPRPSVSDRDGQLLHARHAGHRLSEEHGKTTVAINRLDFAGKRIEYFHNGGFFSLEGEDFDGLFQLHLTDDDPLFLPYAEFAKFPETPVDAAQTRAVSRALLIVHFAVGRAPTRSGPFAVFPVAGRGGAERPFGFFHKYAFNTLRQFGANFELAGRSFASGILPTNSALPQSMPVACQRPRSRCSSSWRGP